MLAQNRQGDRDRVEYEQDGQRAGGTLADNECVTREVAALALAVDEVATKDFVRDEIRDAMKELLEQLREDKKPGKKSK